MLITGTVGPAALLHVPTCDGGLQSNLSTLHLRLRGSERVCSRRVCTIGTQRLSIAQRIALLVLEIHTNLVLSLPTFDYHVPACC